MKLLGVSGSPTRKGGSKTLIALNRAVAAAAAADPDLETEVINVRDYDVEFCDGRDPATYEGDTKFVIDAVVGADALIFATPIYRGSYTGVLKNVFDLLPNDALIGKPVGLIATAGSDHHFLAVEHELKPVLGFFGAHAIPGVGYANNSNYADGDLVDPDVIARLTELGEAVARFARLVPGDFTGPPGPSIPRRRLAES